MILVQFEQGCSYEKKRCVDILWLICSELAIGQFGWEIDVGPRWKEGCRGVAWRCV